MQFIWLPRPLDIAELVLSELVSDSINTKSVQKINIRLIQRLRVIMLISWVIERSKSGMPHGRTFRNCTHRACAIWDLSNHDSLWIIPDPGPQMRISFPVESISTIPFQAGTSYVTIPEWGQHSPNRALPCLISICGTFRRTGDQPNENPRVHFRCPADISVNIANCEIQRRDMMIARTIGQMSFVRCTNDWHNLQGGLPVRSSHGVGLGLGGGAAVTLLLVYVSNRWIDKSIYAWSLWQLHHKSIYMLLFARISPTGYEPGGIVFLVIGNHDKQSNATFGGYACWWQLSIIDDSDNDIFMMTSTTISIAMFNESNYKQWSEEMALVLEHKQVYGIVSGNDEWPPDPAEQVPTATMKLAHRAALKACVK